MKRFGTSIPALPNVNQKHALKIHDFMALKVREIYGKKKTKKNPVVDNASSSGKNLISDDISIADMDDQKKTHHLEVINESPTSLKLKQQLNSYTESSIFQSSFKKAKIDVNILNDSEYITLRSDESPKRNET